VAKLMGQDKIGLCKHVQNATAEKEKTEQGLQWLAANAISTCYVALNARKSYRTEDMTTDKEYRPRKQSIPSKSTSFFKIAGAILVIFFLLWAIGVGIGDETWFGSEGSGWLCFGCMILPVAALIIFLIYKIRTWVTDWRLANALGQEGCIIDGNVSSIKEEARRNKYGDEAKVYFVTYRYQIMGQSFELEEEISRNLYDQLAIGSNVKVCYLPSSPDVARLSN
jgi:hypothetical protein